jgi:hypothetical protein
MEINHRMNVKTECIISRYTTDYTPKETESQKLIDREMNNEENQRAEKGSKKHRFR